MQARERAEKLVKLACNRQQVQLLDGTVAFKKLAWERDSHGNRHFLRYFQFEFTLTGGERCEGIISLKGIRQEYLFLDLPDEPVFHIEKVVNQ